MKVAPRCLVNHLKANALLGIVERAFIEIINYSVFGQLCAKNQAQEMSNQKNMMIFVDTSPSYWSDLRRCG